jgi:hypothetical protein
VVQVVKVLTLLFPLRQPGNSQAKVALMKNGIYQVKGSVMDVDGKTHCLDGEYEIRVYARGLRANLSKHVVADIELDAEGGNELLAELSKMQLINRVVPYKPDMTVTVRALAELELSFQRSTLT